VTKHVAEAGARIAQFFVVNIGALGKNKFWGETERVRSGHATCALLKVGGKRLLVDPSPAPDLLEPMLFDRTGLRPGDVDLVFLTHHHADHWFGLELFPTQPWLMAEAGLGEWRRRGGKGADLVDRFLPAEEHLPEGVDLFPSPGHAVGHCSLSAQTDWGRLIVTGDAVMTREFFEAEEGYHNSVDFEQAADTIRKIKAAADLVAPGHGNYFPNKERR